MSTKEIFFAIFSHSFKHFLVRSTSYTDAWSVHRKDSHGQSVKIRNDLCVNAILKDLLGQEKELQD
jgi:hypothetical protein